MQAEKLVPATKDYIWGGTQLKTRYGLGDTAKVAEAWMLSFHPDGESKTQDGTPISQAVTRKDWGDACSDFPFFPTLVKLIDAADNLSVQVHPSDEYALCNEGQYGKTEMWYIVDAAEGAGIFLGFNRDVSAEEYRAAIAAGKLESILNFVPVHKGESYFIPSGTVHAIGKGCLIAEVQQSSNLTYRVFDYNRLGADGRPRALHVEKAVAVSNLHKFTPTVFAGDVIAACKYFTVRRIAGDLRACNAHSYTSLLVLQGAGTINGQACKAGDSFFVPAGATYALAGKDMITLQTTTEK